MGGIVPPETARWLSGKVIITTGAARAFVKRPRVDANGVWRMTWLLK